MENNEIFYTALAWI